MGYWHKKAQAGVRSIRLPGIEGAYFAEVLKVDTDEVVVQWVQPL